MKRFYFCQVCNKALITCFHSFVVTPIEKGKRKAYCRNCYKTVHQYTPGQKTDVQ